MPMSGSNYVAPTWVDNAPPAIDAAELQAISDTIENNQEEISNLESTKSTVVSGTYTGNVSFASLQIGVPSNPRKINLGFTPKFVIIVPSNGIISRDTNYGNIVYGGVAVTGGPLIYGEGSEDVDLCSITSNGFNVRVFRPSNNINGSCNTLGVTYYYIAGM